MRNVIGHRTLWYTIAGVLVACSVAALAVWRLNIGIDFTGGTLVELSFRDARPAVADVTERVTALGIERVRVQTAGEHNVIIRSASLSDEQRHAVIAAFDDGTNEERHERIGPAIGHELARRTAIAVALSLVGIITYVAWAFRKAGREVASWKYGIVAIVALLHDVLIPLGVFAALGEFLNIEIDAAFIAAALTILGYSVNDTIIIFDRVRENLLAPHHESFADVVNRSVNETFARSINTTLTTLLALLAVVLFGGVSVRYFALALMIGIGLGAYSSIFIAAPLLVTWQERGRQQKA